MQYLQPEDFERAKEHGVPSYLLKDRFYNKKWDIERAITQKPRKPSRKRNPKLEEWMKEAKKNGLEIDRVIMYRRLRQGWTKKRATTEPTRRNPFTDEEYEKLMKNNISEVTARRRMQKGWSREDAVSIPNQKRSMTKYYEIAKKNGITKKTVQSRVYGHGWDIERAITEPVDKGKKKEKFQRLQEEAKKNGINITWQAIKDRLNKGWTEHDAVTKPLGTFTDERKEKIRQYKEIAERNGINHKTFNMRVNGYQWDLERAATEPLLKDKVTERKKWLEIAKQNGIKETTFKSRVNIQGYSYKEAATKPLQKRKKENK